MSKDKVAAMAPPEFDDAGFDGAECVAHEQLEQSMSLLLQQMVIGTNVVDILRRCRDTAVDAALESSLTAVDMCYIERDPEAVTEVSKANSSWSVEPLPQPCDMDTWLRAAIPEANMDALPPSFTMQRFLLNSPSKAPPGRGRPASGDPCSTSPSALGSPRKAAPKIPGMLRKSAGELGPEAQAQQNRLREELALRKAQEQLVRDQEAKDEADKARLKELQRELKGREYTYDHKGQVVILNEFKKDSQPGAGAGTGFRVALPGDNEPAPKGKGGKGGKKEPSAPQPPSHPADTPEMATPLGMPLGKAGDRPKTEPSAAAAAAPAAPAEASRAAGGAAAGRKGVKDRKLVNDFKEQKSCAQPNALDVLNPQAGVTLRQGAQTKQGPQRPKGVQMTRDEYLKYIAKKRRQEQQRQEQVHGEKTEAALSTQASLTRPQTEASTAPQIADRMDEPNILTVTGAEVPSVMMGARPKERIPTPPKPPTPDVNLVLTQASDWGNSQVGGHRSSGEPMPVSKPTDRQRELEIGRTVRLPRDRASQSTAAPPLSPNRSKKL